MLRVYTSEDLSQQILHHEGLSVCFRTRQYFIKRYEEFWPIPLQANADSTQLTDRIRLFVSLNRVRL